MAVEDHHLLEEIPLIPDSSRLPAKVEAQDVRPGSGMQMEPGAAEEEPGQYTAAELVTGWWKPGNHQLPETGCVPELGSSQQGVVAVQKPISMKLFACFFQFYIRILTGSGGGGGEACCCCWL